MGDKKQNKNGKKFRVVFGGGYRKSDVNAYIETMQAQFSGIEETLKGTINHQKEELETAKEASSQYEEALSRVQTLEETLACLQRELEECRQQLVTETQARIEAEDAANAAKAALSSVETERGELQTELEVMHARCEELDRENSVLRAELEVIRTNEEIAAAGEILCSENTLPADYEELKQKAAQYDRMSLDVGAIMLQANSGAEGVLNRANTEAQQILQSAKAKAEEMLAGVNAELLAARVRAQSEVGVLIGSMQQKMSNIQTSCHDEILSDMDDVRAALIEWKKTVDAKYTEIGKKLDYARGEMECAAKTEIKRATAPRALKK